MSEVGSWWSAGAQIDVVGVNRAERRVVLGEAKWLAEPMTPKDLEKLVSRSRSWLEGDTGWDVHYALFNWSGFGPALVAQAEMDRKVHLFTPEMMLAGVP